MSDHRVRTFQRNFQRSCSGNMLPVVIGFLFILLAIFLFSLSMTRMIGSHQEQKTAIESAALAAARDLSKIVVEDPHFGFVSLSDSPPTGTATIAGDNYFLQKKSINTILATIRLDMIIATELNNQDMQQYAQEDYAYAMKAHDQLLNALKTAILPNGFGYDIDGNKVTPYQDAVTAYNDNRVRMNGTESNLVPDSMKLTLGWADGLNTNTPIPNPLQLAQVDSTQQENGFYRPFVDTRLQLHIHSTIRQCVAHGYQCFQTWIARCKILPAGYRQMRCGSAVRV